jgi:hypothetical protein
MIAPGDVLLPGPGGHYNSRLQKEIRGVSILARVLRDRGIVDEKQLEQAIQHQVLYGGRLGTSLHELGLITEEKLQEVLAKVHGIRGPVVDVRQIAPDASTLVPKELAQRYKVFPYKAQGKTLFLLMVDPQDHGAVARIGFSLGYIVKPLVVTEFRMIQLLRDHYGVDEAWRYEDRFRTHGLARTAPLDPADAPERLEKAQSRDEVVEALMALCLGTHRRVLFFIVREPWVLGWDARGEGLDRAAAARFRIPLDEPSVFQTVTRDKTVFVGRFPETPRNEAFLVALGKKPTTNAALFPVLVRNRPVLVRNRVVNLVYVDQGAQGNLKADLGDLLVAVQKVSQAYLRIIRQRVEETRQPAGASPAVIE